MKSTRNRARTGAAMLAVAALCATVSPTVGSNAAEQSAAKAVAAAPTRADLVPPPGALLADGRIEQTIRRGNELIVSGQFRHLGKYSGPAAVLDATSGARKVSRTQDHGEVSVAVPDGNGGWYAGGDTGVSHLLADGSRDPNFNVTLTSDEVDYQGAYALTLVGEVLYVGGAFDQINGTTRHDIAAVSAQGSVLAFEAPDRVGQVSELAYAPAASGRPASVYVGRRHAFPQHELEALDATTGAKVADFAPTPSGDATAMTVSADSLFVGGTRLRALDLTTGAPEVGFAAPVTGGQVDSLLLDGSDLFAGGSFATLAGRPGPLVSLDPATGAADAGFTPTLPYRSGTGGVYALAISDSKLLAGGKLGSTRIGQHVRALNPTTGTALPFAATTYDRQVNTLAVAGAQLLVGGQFTMLDPIAANGFARVNATTLNPVFGSTVRGRQGRMISAGKTIYVAQVNYVPTDRFNRRRVTAINPLTGARIAKLSLSVPGMTGVATSPGKLFVVRARGKGQFHRNTVTALSASNGRVLRNYTMPFRGYVTQALAQGNRLYLSGSFRPLSGRKADNRSILTLNTKTGRVLPGAPFLNAQVDAMEPVPGGGLLVAGLFNKAYAGTKVVQIHRGIARLDSDGVAVRSFKAKYNSVGGPDQALMPVGDQTLLRLPSGRGRLISTATGAQLGNPDVQRAGWVGRTGSGIGVFSVETDLPIAGGSRTSVWFLGRMP